MMPFFAPSRSIELIFDLVRLLAGGRPSLVVVHSGETFEIEWIFDLVCGGACILVKRSGKRFKIDLIYFGGLGT